MGVKLLRRETNKIYLTDAGEKVFESAQEILEQYRQLKLELVPYINARRTNGQNLKILTTSLMCKAVVEKAVFEFTCKYPEVNINICEKGQADIINEIKDGGDAIGILNLRKYTLRQIDFKSLNISFNLLGECGVYASVSNKSPLAQREMLTPAELINYPLVVYDVETHIRTVKEIFKGVGTPCFKISTLDWEFYRKSISRGLGIGISNCLPSTFLQKHPIVNVPLSVSDDLNLQIGYIFSNNTTDSEYVNDIIKTIREICGKEYPVNNLR